MPIFKPASGYRDPLKAMTIKALEQRKQLAEAAAAKATETPASIPSPWQGLAHLTNVLGTGMRENQIGNVLAEKQTGMNTLMGQIDPHEGATQEQIAAMGGYDPEVMKALFSDRATRLRRDQWHAMSPEERAAAGVAPDVFAQQEAESGKIDTANPPSPGVTVNNMPENKGDIEWEQTNSKALSEMLNNASNAGYNADTRIAQVDLLDKMMPTMLHGTEAQISEYLRSQWGIDLGDKANVTTAFNSIVTSLIPEQRQPGSGPMSDKDVILFKGFLPSMLSSPQANKLVSAYLRGIAQYQQQKGAIARQAMQLPNRRAAQTYFDTELRKLANPLAGLEETMAKLGVKTAPASATGSPDVDQILKDAAGG